MWQGWVVIAEEDCLVRNDVRVRRKIEDRMVGFRIPSLPYLYTQSWLFSSFRSTVGVTEYRWNGASTMASE